MRCFKFFAILTAIFFVSCTSETVEKTDNPTSEKSLSKPLIATGFIGFFTQPHHRPRNQAEGSDPVFETIGYIGLDLVAALDTAHGLAALQAYEIVSNEALAAEITRDDRIEVFRKTLDGMLRATRDYALTAATDCEDCINFALSPLSELETYRGWESDDRIILVVGLETPSPANNGLKSSLGGFAFDPSGRYVDHVFVDYNFSSYLTDDLVTDMTEIYEALLPVK
jgi:hypothetical protein